MNTTDRATVSAAAGYQVPKGSELYRDYVITPGGVEHAWSFAHRNYSGPPDSRCGEATSVEMAKVVIDERIDHGFDDDPPPVGYVVWIGGAA